MKIIRSSKALQFFKQVKELINKFFIYWSMNDIIYCLGQIATYGFPSSTKLKSSSISLFKSSSSLSSASSLMWPPFALAMRGVSTSLSIWTSKSQSPYKDHIIHIVYPLLVVDDVHLCLLHVSYFSDT